MSVSKKMGLLLFQLHAIPNKIIYQRLYQKRSLPRRFRYKKSELVVEGCICRSSSIWKLTETLAMSTLVECKSREAHV